MTRYLWTSLDEAHAALQGLRAAKQLEIGGPITLHQTLVHLCQSIECSMRGFPKLKPAILRVTIGPLVAGMFMRRGRMRHNLAAPVPGEPAIAAAGDLEAAWQRLLSAITTFQKWSEPPRPHFMFGKLTHADYDRLHAMHLADHFSQVTPGA